MSEHTWFQDNLAAHLAGGLSTDEAERFGRHRVACGACAKILADAQSFDGAMESLFAPVRPEAGWENRVIDNLRAAPKWQRRRWSGWARVAMSAAAVVVLGVVGAVLHGVVGKGSLVFPGSLGELRMAQKVKDDRSSIALEAESKVSTSFGVLHESGQGWGEWEGRWHSGPQPTSDAPGQSLALNKLGRININTLTDPTLLNALINDTPQYSEQQTKARSADGSAKETLGDRHWPFTLSADKENQNIEKLKRFDVNGELAKQIQDLSDETIDRFANGRVEARAEKPTNGTTAATGLTPSGTLTPPDGSRTTGANSPAAGLLYAPESAEFFLSGDLNKQTDRQRVLALQPAIPSPTAPPPAPPVDQGGLGYNDFAKQTATFGLRINRSDSPAAKGKAEPVPVNLGTPISGVAPVKRDTARQLGFAGAYAEIGQQTAPATAGAGASPAPLPSEGKPAEPGIDRRSGATFSPPANQPARAEYFKPPLAVAKAEAADQDRIVKDQQRAGVSAGFGAGKQSKASDSNETKALAEQDKEPGQPEQPPEAAGRKIIRTGQMEFEVDSFDSAVAGVSKIVNNVKGGFVATVNSDKLPNGKVKGSIVVRMPPERLDKFLLDVRQELAKTGELKSQRIGSQDVTKQYTDVESRLRGARAMEERFIQIIKTGKGEIKDLIVAENALGVWRTKIEEMEGEIRYFNNQVGLSTLTITLVEKEIQAPASLVVTERVKMQLEVDDVEKAHAAALTAVNEAKGRVTKSELKQHAAGQLEAILHFEVAPAAAAKVKDRLKQLGYVTNQTADRSEQAQGAGSAANIKLKQSDVKFEVAMYNVANIQPREVLSIQIGCQDVAQSFKKLQEAALKAKAQVRNGQLNEQDKNNVTAQFDVDVPTPEKKTLDQAVSDAGTVLSRTATQAGPGEAATDRKVGYRLVLRMAPTVTVTERQIIQLEVDDVDKAVQAAKAAVTEAGGRVTKSELQQLPAGQLKVFLHFEIAPAEADKVRDRIRQLGIVTHQTSDRTQQGEGQAADVKFKQNDVKFEVTMYNTANIRPREELIIQIASLDVPGSFKKLQDAVLKAKGQVRAGQLNEQDKVNVSAELNFDIPVSEKKIVDQVLAEAGKVLSRTSSQAAPGEAATDRKVGYRMTIRNVATVAAREKEQFAIEVKDVDQTVSDILDIVKSRQGRVVGATTNHLSNGQVTAVLECDLPLTVKDELIRNLKSAGNVRVHKSARNPQVPDNELATAHFEIALATAAPIVPSDEGLWPQIRTSLYYSFRLLAWSLMFVILGFMVILPWVLVLWLVLKLIGRWRRKPEAGTVG